MAGAYEAPARLSILAPRARKSLQQIPLHLSAEVAGGSLPPMAKVFAATWFWSSVLAVALTVSACHKPEPPTVRPRSVAVKSVGPQGLTLALELDVQNPNSFALSAHAVDGVLALGNGVELGRAAASPESPIPAKGSAVVPSELSVSFTNLGALAPFALSDQPVPYRFKGQAQIGSERLNVAVPFELAGELTRAQLLQIGLRGLGTLPR